MAILNGSNGPDTLTTTLNTTGGPVATSGADSIAGLNGNDWLDGGGGPDTLDPGSGFDTVIGGAGTDRIILNANALVDADSIDGGGDRDRLDLRGSAAFPVMLELMLGRLDLRFAPGQYFNVADIVLGSIEEAEGTEFGDELIADHDGNFFQGHGGNDTLFGADGDDTFVGGDGADLLWGGLGNDVLRPGAPGAGEAETVHGGSGIDWLSYSDGQLLGVSLAFSDGVLTGTGLLADDRLTFIENVEGSANADRISALGGSSHHLRGLGGADTLVGDIGDTLEGGLGPDRYLLAADGALVIETGNGTGDVFEAAYSLPLPDVIEDLMLTGDAVWGFGNAQDNRLTGNAGDNILAGLDGADTLDGGAGADVLIGGPGDDVYIVDDPDDQVVEQAGERASIRASVSFNLVTASDLRLLGSGDLVAVGSGGGDSIEGNAGANLLDGGNGQDSLLGESGADTLLGGAGYDSLSGAQDSDSLVGGEGDDTVWGGSGADTLLGHGGKDSLEGGEDHDRLSGDAGDDTLLGGAGNDTVVGGVGNDFLVNNLGADLLAGGAGNDAFQSSSPLTRMRGDAGADIFGFNLYGQSVGTVLDFDRTEGDRLDLLDVTAVPRLPTLPEDFVTNLTGMPTANRPQFIYETDSGRLWFDGDGLGASQARYVLITLLGAPTLTADDILY